LFLGTNKQTQGFKMKETIEIKWTTEKPTQPGLYAYETTNGNVLAGYFNPEEATFCEKRTLDLSVRWAKLDVTHPLTITANHTPAPWAKDFISFALREAHRQALPWECVNDPAESNRPGEKDVQLISSAPKLLRALKDLWNLFEDVDLSCIDARAMNQAAEVIAEAEKELDS